MITFKARASINISDNYLKKIEESPNAEFNSANLVRAAIFVKEAAPLVGTNEDEFRLQDSGGKLQLRLNGFLPLPLGYQPEAISDDETDKAVQKSFLNLCKQYFERKIDLPWLLGETTEDNIDQIKSMNMD